MSGIEELLIGRRLADRYRIEEVIGRGGMGAVYRATDLRLEREVAVKVIAVALPDPEERERLRARFEREARAAARIRHPNVVTIYDFGTDPQVELDFLVMELLRGEDLAARLARSGPPPLLPAVTILRDAARGIGAGHQLGMIHRDVKPGNLFLSGGSGQPRVTVLDFGIAQLAASEQTLTHLTQEGGAPLSPAYASPEQLRGERNLTPASDVFSLGAIGFQLLTGERLFEVARGGRRLGDEGVPVPPIRARNPVVPQHLETIIRQALAHHPEQRFPDAGTFAEALTEAGKSLVSGTFARHASTPPPKIVPPPAPAPAAEWEAAATIPSPRMARREESPPEGSSPHPPVESAPAPEVAPPPGPRLEPATSAAPRRPASPAPGTRRRFSPALLALPLLLAGALAGGWWLLDREPETQSSERPAASVADPQPAPASPASPAETTQVARGEPDVEEASPPVTPASEETSTATPRQESAPAPATSPETPTPATEQPASAASTPEAAGGSSAAQLNVEGVRLFEQGNLAAARDRSRRAAELAPQNAEYRNNYGWVLFRLGEVEAAERELRRVIELNPRREIAHANLGEVRAARGDTAEAIAMYERFLELNRDPRRQRVAEQKLRELRSP
ncbi:MAG: protein kinase domain-containing protein [Longimicrobiaceae bacterium]